MTRSGIYLIKHKTEANLVYVGKSIDIDQRWKQHTKGHRSAKKLQEAFSEYGVNSFEFKILEEISNPSEMGKRETYYIDLYDSWKNGLNGSRAGGEWGRHARSFVKNHNGFNAYNGTERHKESSRKAGSIGGLRANSNVYRMTHSGQTYIFVGTSIISQFLKINSNTLRNWATTGKKFRVFSNSFIEILGKASKLTKYQPNTVYKEEKSGELLEAFRRDTISKR
jgi:predicted GIY-YIG superfamily endonuclease